MNKHIPDLTIPEIEAEIEKKEGELGDAKRLLTASNSLISTLEKNLDLLRLLKELKENNDGPR